MPFDTIERPPLSKVARLLIDAKSRIHAPHLWTQCYPVVRQKGHDTRYCMTSAVFLACRGKSCNYNYNMVKRLCILLAQELPKKVWRWDTFAQFRLEFFNDRRTTKHADVMALFDRAIERQVNLTASSILAEMPNNQPSSTEFRAFLT